MSKGPWKRDPKSGLSLAAITKVLPDLEGKPCRVGLLADEVQNDDGTLKTEAFPDCNVFHVNTATWLASGLPEGKKPNVKRLKERILNSSRCHFYPIETEDGKLIGMASHSTSFQAWGEWDRAERAENSRKNLKRGAVPAVKSFDLAVADKPLINSRARERRR